MSACFFLMSSHESQKTTAGKREIVATLPYKHSSRIPTHEDEATPK